MSLEEQISDRLQKLYPGHDARLLFERCVSTLGSPRKASSRGRWSEKDALLICYPDQVVTGGDSPLATLSTILDELRDGLSGNSHS